jgi:hypothetical protein
VKKNKYLVIKLIMGAFSLALVIQSFVWTRFENIRVFDGADEFDPSHNVETYWDDDLDAEIKISWSRRDINEAFIMQAASWEALDREVDEEIYADKREVIFVTSAREACAA